ncbi:hypothetical protein BDN71DRAFT_1436716 [Pleurotus eryngii]|uniref:Uncharacterized protein n=1 Tax=Pleurotus eryngii TaxID=5323 RepID=A0A9P6D8G8_PLEER|nr:hypothetical protein BDN71DRAFT_1436716 [Pleurotus eryngii]
MWAAWMPIAQYYLHEYLSLHSRLPGSPCAALASTYSLKDTVTQSPIPSTPLLMLYPSSTGSSSGDHTIQILSMGCWEAHAWIGRSCRRSMNVALWEAHTQNGLPGSPCLDLEVPSSINECGRPGGPYTVDDGYSVRGGVEGMGDCVTVSSTYVRNGWPGASLCEWARMGIQAACVVEGGSQVFNNNILTYVDRLTELIGARMAIQAARANLCKSFVRPLHTPASGTADISVGV